MNKRLTLRVTTALACAFALAGCNHTTPQAPQRPVSRAQPARAATAAPLLESNSVALQGAIAKCRQTTPRYTTDLPPGCAQVANAALAVRLQYAAGIDELNTATMEMRAAFVQTGHLPPSNATTRDAALTPSVAVGDAGTTRATLSVGPSPGLVTVTWSGGALAGERLVATPAARAPGGPCWQIDPTATTVPISVQRLGPVMSNACD